MTTIPEGTWEIRKHCAMRNVSGFSPLIHIDNFLPDSLSQVEIDSKQEVVVYDQSSKNVASLSSDSFLTVLLGKLEKNFCSVRLLIGRKSCQNDAKRSCVNTQTRKHNSDADIAEARVFYDDVSLFLFSCQRR